MSQTTFSPNNNKINVTPEAIQLSIFTGAAPGAGQSSNGQLLYNNINLIDGVPNTSFASGNLTLGNIANIKITGGSFGQYIRTDGAGNLTWAPAVGGTGAPGGLDTQIQFNDGGLFGGNSGFTFNKSSGNVAIAGNLSVAGNIFGNVNANYSNFAGTAFSVNGSNVTGEVANATFATTAGTVTTNAQPNITSIGTLTSLGVNGNIVASNITANTGIFTGNGSGLSAIVGANVTGSVSSAITATTAGSATTAGTVTTNAQPNITSVGTLTSLGVSGNITAANITANTGVFAGSGANLTTLNASNISSGTLAQARLANASVTLGSTALTLGSTVTTVAGLSSVTSTTFVGSLSGGATTAGTVTTAAQPNITSVGTLTSLGVTGNISGGNLTTAGALSALSSNITTAQLNRYQERTFSLGNVNGTITPNFNNGSIQEVVLTGNITLNSLSNALAGASMTLIVRQDATGGRTLTSSMLFAGGSKTLSTDPSAVDVISIFFSGGIYYATLSKGYV